MISPGKIEEVANLAWPSLELVIYDGWELRFSNGLNYRSNSVSTHDKSSIDLLTKIDFCERQYEKRGLTTAFKISNLTCPTDLDHILEASEYKRVFDINILTLNSSSNPPLFQRNSQVHYYENASIDWITAYSRLSGLGSQDMSTLKSILTFINPPKCLMTYRVADHIIGCGLGVVTGKYLGIFDIVVHKEHRNIGIGKSIVNSLLEWGIKNGAETSYLQVLASNQYALNLYRSFGFKTEYVYWYRIKHLYVFG